MADHADKQPFLVFGAPRIEQPEIDEVVAVLQSGWLGTGPRVMQFETDFSAYKGVAREQVAAVNSCTAALHLSLLAAGVGPGDEVITTPMTFCATVNSIIHAGATPVLADVEPDTMNIDPREIARHIGPRTRAIVPAHFAGRPCAMDAIMAVARDHGLAVIEDCAHAIEAQYKGRATGTIGDFGCFSFYVTKNIVTGEGGMALCARAEDAARVRTLALHGISKDAWKRFDASGYQHYDVVEPGFKYNMMDLQAAIGMHQLRRIEPYWQQRRAIWARYQEAFADLPVQLPEEPGADTRHAYHLYTLRIDAQRAGIDRDGFLAAMSARQIGVGVHYRSLTNYAFYRERFGWRNEDYPNAWRIGEETVSIPFTVKLDEHDIERVITAVRSIVSEARRTAGA